MKSVWIHTLSVVVAAGFSLSASAGSIVSVTAMNSDTHPQNAGIGTFKTGDSLTVANGATIILPNPYTVPVLGASSAGAPVYAYSDRNHAWTGFGTGLGGAANPVNFPSYLAGLDYMMTMNANRDNTVPPLQIDITTSGPGTAYLFIDNRLGDGSGTDAPTLTGPLVQWITLDGWTAVNTGLKPADYTGNNDILGIDEANDGTINQYATIYSRTISGTSFSVYTFGEGRDMYGVAFAPVPEPGVLALTGVGIALAGFLRFRRR